MSEDSSGSGGHGGGAENAGSEGADRVVEVACEIEADAQTVWDILATPDRFSAWIGGRTTFELRGGSPFRAEFPEYDTVIAGEVVAVDAAARRLSLTWGVESGPQAESLPAASSRVEFRVEDSEAGCLTAVRHSGFRSAQSAQEHDAGWRFHVGRLAFFANRTDLAAGLERTLRIWFEAWNETDAGKRLELLRACCFEDVEFRDPWAVAGNVESLNLHIGNCHRFMPGWKIEAGDDLRICRGEALAGWRSQGPTGETKGASHVRAAHDGRIRRVASFEER